ncbi:MAG TPA: PEGA domain-containing protein, partial [Methanoregulaceae archaeon]|nr:PEGA domain-containing protein [Methanoregulaceae archaeon]
MVVVKTSVVAGIFLLFLIGMVPSAVAGDEAGDQEGLFLLSSPENGTVWIGSIPASATIYIDDVDRGLTNQYVTNVSAGTHTLTLAKAGYQNLSSTLVLSPGDLLVLPLFTLPIDDESEAGTGTVWIGSIPTNATMYIDGVDKGLTNAYVTNLT